MIVLDASMALAWIFERENKKEAQHADCVLQKIKTEETLVPALWHIEISNGLLLGERRKIITEAQVIDYFSRLSHLPLMTDSVAPSSVRNLVHSLGREYGLTTYDAIYLELSLRTNSALATFDIKLAAAMEKAGGVVSK